MYAISLDQILKKSELIYFFCTIPMCREWDLHPQGLYTHRILSPACLLISSPRQKSAKSEATVGIAPTYTSFAEKCITTLLRGQFIVILYYFCSFFNPFNNSSILPALLISLSFINFILGIGRILNILLILNCTS